MRKSTRRESNTEALEREARAATAAGMTYGQWQQRQYLAEYPTDKDKLRDRQPVHIENTGEDLCPECAHQLTLYRNCKHCGKTIIWKRG